jgi:hypothetical protein
MSSTNSKQMHFETIIFTLAAIGMCLVSSAPVSQTDTGASDNLDVEDVCPICLDPPSNQVVCYLCTITHSRTLLATTHFAYHVSRNVTRQAGIVPFVARKQAKNSKQRLWLKKCLEANARSVSQKHEWTGHTGYESTGLQLKQRYIAGFLDLSVSKEIISNPKLEIFLTFMVISGRIQSVQIRIKWLLQSELQMGVAFSR